MSETVYYKGKLKDVVRLDNETLEEQCKRIINCELDDDYYKTFKEMLLDEYYDKYVIYGDILYSIVEKISLDADGSIFNMSNDDDGTLNFEVRYYNGGCSFDEAIECAFERKEMLKDVFGN